eukprot:1160643-Pelagomonas_calceolata.AAC.6
MFAHARTITRPDKCKLNGLSCATSPLRQDEEHFILDSPPQDVTNLRTPFQHLSSSAPPSGASQLKRFHKPG